MIQDSIKFDVRALSVFEEALDELENPTDDDAYHDFAVKVARWFTDHWIVSDDYTTFYPSKRFRRKDDFDFSSVVSELQEILDYYNALVAFQLSKVGE